MYAPICSRMFKLEENVCSAERDPTAHGLHAEAARGDPTTSQEVCIPGTKRTALETEEILQIHDVEKPSGENRLCL